MRRYELMLLLRPDLDDEHLQGAVERVTRAIVNAGGSLSKVSPWGKRRLAYEISHQRDASYFLIHFEIDPAAIREIERGMQISEEILRHMLTILEERPTGTGRSDGDAARSRTGAPRAESAGDRPDSADMDADEMADADESVDADEAPVPADSAGGEATEVADGADGDVPDAEPAGDAADDAADAPARSEA